MTGRLALILIPLVSLVLHGPAAASSVAEPQQDPPQKSERAEDEGQERKRAEEAAASERQEEIQEIEPAAKESWLSRWRRFRQASRDISQWDLNEGMFRMRFGLRVQGDLTAGSESTALGEAVGPVKESAEFRRARLFADGDFLRRSLLLRVRLRCRPGPEGLWWVQAEFPEVRPDVIAVGRLAFRGAYVQLGWFLTGEHRPYIPEDGTFGRLEPSRPYERRGNPFRKGSNGGAIEFSGRLSSVDLDDGPVRGGEMYDLTLGMSWYATRATRVTFNYVRSRLEDVGQANIFLIRYQFNPGYHWPPLDPRWRHAKAGD